jgi:hypothetical protein
LVVSKDEPFRMRRYSAPVRKLCDPIRMLKCCWNWNWLSVKNCGKPLEHPRLTPSGSKPVTTDGWPSVPGHEGKSRRWRR